MNLVELVCTRTSCGHECSSENPGPRVAGFYILQRLFLIVSRHCVLRAVFNCCVLRSASFERTAASFHVTAFYARGCFT
ncbi:hypothetical protein HanRHA438_Chr10g0462181 [Helianthus annuus]|nr:hypothetical protein HanRHA438_Chr10g0462181 [Helianthus annuus]